MNPTVARRFPLIARPRPVCTPLDQRVSDLQRRADLAWKQRHTASATAVFNLAALLASDCGLPDLARTWCHRLATVILARDCEPQHALEPIVNLARLHIRAGNGPSAWNLLETLFHAVDTRTDVTIDGLTIPAARLTSTPDTYATARSWLWTVLLGTGAHALATAGRWDEARDRLNRYKGIGARMLDGRQIAVIAHATAGRHQQASAMLEATQPGEPWEDAVTACLALHIRADDSTDHATAALTTYRALSPIEPGLATFRIRLGLTLADGLGSDHPDANKTKLQLIEHATQDGYATREILAHPGTVSLATNRQIRQLNDLASACGLGQGTLRPTYLSHLNNALHTAEAVLSASAAKAPS